MTFILGIIRAVGLMLLAAGGVGLYMHFSLLPAVEYSLFFKILLVGFSAACILVGLVLTFLRKLVMIAVPMLVMMIVQKAGGIAMDQFGPRQRGFNSPFP